MFLTLQPIMGCIMRKIPADEIMTTQENAIDIK